MRKLLLPFFAVALVGMLTGCVKASWINDISVSPDGNRVDVVGAQMKRLYGGWIVDKPLRWVCVRDGSGALTCQHMTKELPTMD